MANAPVKTPKMMSSRLMTMKFMQRAAAAASSPETTPENASKRRKTESNTPNSASSMHRKDLQAFKAAAESEEAKRIAAVERQVRESGETRWVLSYQQDQTTKPAVQIVQTGFAGIDDGTDESDESDKPAAAVTMGRRTFGGYKRQSEQPTQTGNDESSDPSDENVSEEEVASTKSNRYKTTTPIRNSAAKGGISGAGGTRCYNCGGTGHMRSNCPQPTASARREKLAGIVRQKRARDG